MSAPAAPRPGATDPPEQRQEEGGFMGTLQSLARMALIYLAVQYAVGYFAKRSAPASSSNAPADAVNATMPKLPNTAQLVAPLWPLGTHFALKLYVSEDATPAPIDLAHPDLPVPLWSRDNLTLGDWGLEVYDTIDVAIPEAAQHNGSLYAHLIMDRLPESRLPAPGTTDPTDGNKPMEQGRRDFDPDLDRRYIRQPLTTHIRRRTVAKTRNLLRDSTTPDSNESPDAAAHTNSASPALADVGDSIYSYWYGNLTLNLLTEAAPLPYHQMPPAVREQFKLLPADKVDPVTQHRLYAPLLYTNRFWILEANLQPVNVTTPTLPLNLHVYPISFFKLQFYATMQEQMKQQLSLMGGMTGGGEFDEFKRMLVETNPWLLGITVLVTLLHSLFDFLAFKNDISFWKNKKGAAGISVRTIFANIAFQLIIFLYLLDNQKVTSWMILMSQGVGLLIEVWKIKKAVDVQVRPVGADQGVPIVPCVDKTTEVEEIPPTATDAITAEAADLAQRRTLFNFAGYQVTVKGAAQRTDEENRTQEYDETAYRYLTYLAYPLLAGYAGYSLYYEEHKSWYSFVINTLVGFVYAFGFITMTPQLFINYKLKSVAHMPWRTFMYKALNTFVDDLFAFVITMPTLHRLACLRDDVVFVVYLYQKWIYPMDPNRANEFGQVAQEPVDQKEVKRVKKAKSKVRSRKPVQVTDGESEAVEGKKSQ
ncbi:hypothetical protein IWQ60_007470 [Tieghemiomyces parasiticus]|uniref:Cleft lip and palate associated transmembrane protein n=1 Tax=Tieghemiomyces parasiticus TaxID=78921 RepID=A0A9W7ZX74_9FUNG|nr:hypothetical protein IWQ60_007470 [Tieghemiomyces parasiticus]